MILYLFIFIKKIDEYHDNNLEYLKEKGLMKFDLKQGVLVQGS